MWCLLRKTLQIETSLIYTFRETGYIFQRKYVCLFHVNKCICRASILNKGVLWENEIRPINKIIKNKKKIHFSMMLIIKEPEKHLVICTIL